jgi:hypothetical protein
MNSLSSAQNDEDFFGAHLLKLRCKEQKVKPSKRPSSLLIVSLIAIFIKYARELLQVISVLGSVLLLLFSSKAKLCPQPIFGGSSDLQVLSTDIKTTDNLV